MSDVSAHKPEAARPFDGPSLAAYTTLRLGGPVDRLVIAANDDEIIKSVRGAQDPLFVLAGGSNVVVGDAGVRGTTVLVRSRGITVAEGGASNDHGDHRGRDDGHVILTVAAGEPWDNVVAEAVDRGYAGLECLAGIPGSAGATPIQNVGAYGQEVAETISSVRVFDRVTDEVRTYTAAQCGFVYRSSIFKHSTRWIVLSVDFRLRRSDRSVPIRYAELARALAVAVGERVPLADARAAVLRLRAGKGMVLDSTDPDTYSVGSFFTNPILDAGAYQALRERAADVGEPPAWPGTDGVVKVSAAWLIERAGFGRGYSSGGGVGISTKHTLALTNRGAGSTEALLALAREIRDGVRARFGVVLHPEPVLVGCEL